MGLKLLTSYVSVLRVVEEVAVTTEILTLVLQGLCRGVVAHLCSKCRMIPDHADMFSFLPFR